MPFSKHTPADEVLTGLDLRGRSILVTGANSGIGFETARALAAAGARVHLGARSTERAEEAIARVVALHPGAELVPFPVDLGSLADCRAAAERFADPALHALIANAGVYGGAYTETSDGLERTVGVCHFGHAMLIRGLLPKLIAGAPSRLVMVASESHRGEKALDPARPLMTAADYREMGAYDRAKLCNVLYANAFDRRFRDRGVRANSLHPGSLVSTGISRHSLLAKVAMAVVRPFSKSLTAAASTSVWAAVHPDLADRGGEYLVDCQIGKANVFGRDQALADRLWEHTEVFLERFGG